MEIGPNLKDLLEVCVTSVVMALIIYLAVKYDK